MVKVILLRSRVRGRRPGRIRGKQLCHRPKEARLNGRIERPAADEQRDDEQDQENVQENLGDRREVSREAAETENSGDQGEDGEEDCPANHGRLRPFLWKWVLLCTIVTGKPTRAPASEGGGPSSAPRATWPHP